MTAEDRLRDAIRAHTDSVEPGGEWEQVRHRALFARRRRRVMAAGGTALAVAAAIVVAVVAVPALRDGDQDVQVGPADTTDATDPEQGPTTTTVVTEPAVSPFVYESDAANPEDAAVEFATRYLGMSGPIVDKVAEGGPDDVQVMVRATERGAITTIGLEPTGGGFGVRFASTDNIELTSPRPLDTISSPFTVTGRARAFEGTVQVEVREDGQPFGERLGEGFVTASGGPSLGPFEGSIDFGGATESAGAVVLYTESAEDGSVWEATVVRVRLAGCTYSPSLPSPAQGETDVQVWFSCGDGGFGATVRRVRSTSPLRDALSELTKGPTTDEQAAGLHSAFSADTAGLVTDVNLTADGVAVVDFADTIPNASTSAGSQAFVGQLTRTVFQFETVRAIEFQLRGSCPAFWEWLQSECHLVERP